MSVEVIVTTSDQQDTGLTKISEFVFIDFKKQNKTHTHKKKTETRGGLPRRKFSWEKNFPDSLGPSIAFLSLWQ